MFECISSMTVIHRRNTLEYCRILCKCIGLTDVPCVEFRLPALHRRRRLARWGSPGRAPW